MFSNQYIFFFFFALLSPEAEGKKNNNNKKKTSCLLIHSAESLRQTVRAVQLAPSLAQLFVCLGWGGALIQYKSHVGATERFMNKPTKYSCKCAEKDRRGLPSAGGVIYISTGTQRGPPLQICRQSYVCRSFALSPKDDAEFPNIPPRSIHRKRLLFSSKQLTMIFFFKGFPAVFWFCSCDKITVPSTERRGFCRPESAQRL